VTVTVIVSKGRCADDGPHAINRCDQTTISNRGRRGARRRDPDQHRRIGSTQRPGCELDGNANAANSHTFSHIHTLANSNAHAGADTSDGHDPGAGLSAEHGARL
jgi:hypothetical protein